ncbi:heparin lyase I family protein [Conexibacter woesei]|uniref:PKD domain containing protein n=1 Tax=Conexibacter woesei (strain DSM 14684 / CCUG 47730 / CIP 108061 / JCM 11494 / NBRC 100937 / ID131577) TaxID=469383 RepID=D3F9S0_CONWI|nr:heparin lyase I family protein [Conexibacter woesei]ADB51132.1 PKD domain containing protein [Conexibacter woesei DSM 14684]
MRFVRSSLLFAALALLLVATRASATPTAAFTHSPAVPNPGQLVTFDAGTSVCDVTPCTYSWDDVASDGPGAPDYPLGSGTPLTFTFRNAGTKYVRLIVTNRSGQSHAVQRDVVVAPAPLWVGDVDTCDASQWADLQDGRTPTLRALFGDTLFRALADNPSVADDTRTNNGCSGWFWVDDTISPTSGPRAEVLTDEHMRDGTEFWYGTSIYVDSDPNATIGFASGTHHTLTQWKGSSSGSPPLELGIGNWGRGNPGNGLVFIVARTDGNIRTAHTLVPLANIYDHWWDLAVRVKFSSDASVGEYEVWLDGRQVVSTRRDRTLVAGRDSYLKQGYYGGGNGNVILIDETRRGTSRWSVDPSLRYP